MQKSLLFLTTELTDHLMRFPALVHQFERKDPQALHRFAEWLTNAEALLSTYRLVAAAEIAGFKSKLLSPLYHDDHRGSLRKRQLAVAIDLLDASQQCLQQVLAPYQDKLTKNRELIKQLLTIVSQSQAISYSSDGGVEQLIEEVWLFINQHDQLKAGAVQLKSQLSNDDIRLLLAEEINPAEFPH